MRFGLKLIMVFVLLTWSIVILFFYLYKNNNYKLKRQNDDSLQRASDKKQTQENESNNIFNPDVYLNDVKLLNKENAYEKHKFNQWKSDQIQWNRHIPDTRNKHCLLKKYPRTSDLPATSIIITFHNEARSTLLRTIKSVLDRTPPSLLKEIILVDDFSDDPKDGRLLLQLQKIKLIRNAKREGLIRSRIFGADLASSDILTFLDSHCEANVHWLEPLLSRLHQSSKSVVCPVIDAVHLDTFQYVRTSDELKGGFDWNMLFKWDILSDVEKNHHRKNPTDPIKTPVIAGGLFSIRKNWFYKLGKYDSQMNIWGGENFEISFKTWLCGGNMEILPCSRVGHVFRAQHPYTFPDGNAVTYHTNVQRTAEVWMDSYKKYFYKARGGMMPLKNISLQERFELRASLHCKSFEWYLDNVYPELRIPAEDSLAYGELKQIIHKNPLCVSNPSENLINAVPCHLKHGDQEWTMTKSGLIRNSKDHCLKATIDIREITLDQCNSDDVNQRWKIMIRDRLRHDVTNLCMELIDKTFQILSCKEHTLSQMWRFSLRFYY